MAYVEALHGLGLGALADILPHTECAEGHSVGVVKVPHQGERTNKLEDIFEQPIVTLYDDKGVEVVLTAPASPHTNDSVSRQEFHNFLLEKNKLGLDYVHLNNGRIAKHFMAVVGGATKTYDEVVVAPDERRAAIFKGVEGKLCEGIALFMGFEEVLSPNSPRDLPVIYAYSGYNQDRDLGVSPQSVEPIHYHFGENSETKRNVARDVELSGKQLARHFSPLDHAFFGLYEDLGRHALADIFKRRGINTCSVRQAPMDTMGEGATMQGLQVIASEPLDFTTAEHIRFDFIKEGTKVYSDIRDFYDQFYMHLGDASEKKTVRDNLTRYLHEQGLSEEHANAQANTILGMRPTHGQLTTYITTMRDEGRQPDDNSLMQLEALRERYNHAAHNFKKYPHYYERAVRMYMGNFNISREQAKMALAMFIDTIDPEVSRRQVTMNAKFATAWFTDDYTVNAATNELSVRSFTIASRFGTSSGVPEAMLNASIVR